MAKRTFILTGICLACLTAVSWGLKTPFGGPSGGEGSSTSSSHKLSGSALPTDSQTTTSGAYKLRSGFFRLLFLGATTTSTSTTSTTSTSTTSTTSTSTTSTTSTSTTSTTSTSTTSTTTTTAQPAVLKTALVWREGGYQLTLHSNEAKNYYVSISELNLTTHYFEYKTTATISADAGDNTIDIIQSLRTVFSFVKGHTYGISLRDTSGKELLNQTFIY